MADGGGEGATLVVEPDEGVGEGDAADEGGAIEIDGLVPFVVGVGDAQQVADVGAFKEVDPPSDRRSRIGRRPKRGF